MYKRLYILAFLLLLLSLAACQSTILPTRMVLAPTVDINEQSSNQSANIPATWTLVPSFLEQTSESIATEPAPSTSTPAPTVTEEPLVLPPTETPIPIPTSTALPQPPTNTAVPLPTNTTAPVSTNTPIPLPPTDTPPPPPTHPPPPDPGLGVNLLPNGSFEEGHYNSGGVGELQVPNHWTLIWDGGTNPFVAPPDNYFVRPETRVLPNYQLPAHEQSLYIWDGQYTIKIFKGYWAINVELVTDVYLEPGTYLFEINVFPDLVVDYSGGQKVYATDPYAGEVRFIVTGGGTGWFPPGFGYKNTFTHTFSVGQAQSFRIGVGLRNRYGIMNNGWFLDDWSLVKIAN